MVTLVTGSGDGHGGWTSNVHVSCLRQAHEKAAEFNSTHFHRTRQRQTTCVLLVWSCLQIRTRTEISHENSAYKFMCIENAFKFKKSISYINIWLR